ncbi:MAG TPA: hypothetical protein VFF22_04750 [Pseudomonas sp.]|nr:hypothetical protein [Pseudomonas sp.]
MDILFKHPHSIVLIQEHRRLQNKTDENMSKKSTSLKSIAATISMIFATYASGFQLSPEGTIAEQQMASKYGVKYKTQIIIMDSSMHKFADPAHEALTQKSFGCDGDWDDCDNPDLENAGPYIIAGVRWNDDPVFMLSSDDGKIGNCNTKFTVGFITQTRCWVGIFKSAEKQSRTDSTRFMGKGNYMTRSHFGDLQFLHAMASQDGESADQTKQKIMMWAEFTWGVVEGKYKLNTYLSDIEIPGWDQHFTNDHTVQDLFTVGRPWLRPHIKEMAIGSLLHLVQDSFAAGHVNRRDAISGDQCTTNKHPTYGRIKEFHSYSKQDHSKHKEEDASSVARMTMMKNDPDMVDAGKRLRGYFADQKSWEEVQPYLNECVFALNRTTKPASAGTDYM